MSSTTNAIGNTEYLCSPLNRNEGFYSNLGKPFLALNYEKQFDSSKLGFTKECKWAPDGSCLLVASNDRKLRLFNLPDNVINGTFNDEDWMTEGWKKDSTAALMVKEGENIYDYLWYPAMNSNDPQSSCFAVTCRDLPIHLWDAWKGKLICSYNSFNHLDQLIAARSLCFSRDGASLLCGFKKLIKVFKTSLPGKDSYNIKPKEQSGIISCINFHPVLHDVFAAGSYSGSVGLYSLDTQQDFCLLDAMSPGVTCVRFSKDGNRLYSGTRKGSEIICWDIRNPGQILGAHTRTVDTNQRITYDLATQDELMVSGSTAGDVLWWDLSSCYSTEPGTIEAHASFKANLDCVNGVSIHPTLPLLATSSGQRHVDAIEGGSGSEGEEGEGEGSELRENGAKLWWLGQT